MSTLTVDIIKAIASDRVDIIEDYWNNVDPELNELVEDLFEDLDLEDQAMVIKELYGGYVVMVGAVVVAMGTRAECRAWLRKAVAQMDRWDSKYNRTVAEIDDISILASKTIEHIYFLVLDSKIVRKDMFMDDKAAKEWYGYMCQMKF